MLGSLPRLVAGFAGRFQPDGDGFLFRSKLGAPAFRFSTAERDALVADFARRILWLTWGAGGSAVMAIAGLTWASVVDSWDMPSGLLGGVAVALIALYMILVYWLWYAPLRALHGRPEAAAGLPKAEAARVGFQRLTWGRLGTAALTVPLLLWRVVGRHGSLAGWNLVWIAVAAVLGLLIAVQAFRKWRVERSHDPALDGPTPGS